MSIILFITTITLDFASVTFAGVYVWLNTFSKISDLSDRNTSILKIIKSLLVLSMIFAFLTCLFSTTISIEEAIRRVFLLYLIIALSWLMVLVGCGAAMIYALLSKSSFKNMLFDAIKKIFTPALVGTVIGIVLAWLFS